LGCGYGENCAEFLRLGASTVTGVDISQKMLEVAQNEAPSVEFIRRDMSDLSFLVGREYDVVFSSLALHYIENLEKLAKQVASLLAPRGYFIFSQEHPLNTAPMNGPAWTRDENGNALHYNLTDYGIPGQRSTRWIVDGVIKYHRTFSETVNSLICAGFEITKMLEPLPSEDDIQRDTKKKKEIHKPNFLLIKAQKSGKTL
ncbi:MAG: class I SAM-dependent methyltransferase, partial [Clostridia bacterium]|nr:class I SAM-dependent methyltransferase [Clostridia bacterium]